MATRLQQAVWQAITMIPEGKVTTYGAIARYLRTKAIRAVASAVGKNPDAPDVPCHRVIRANGEVGEYSAQGGKATKIRLLKQEGVEIVDGKVVRSSVILDDLGTLIGKRQR